MDLQPAFGLVPVLLRPFSRGRIMLKSRNPFHWPRMQPNFFSDQRDIQTLTKGIRSVTGIYSNLQIIESNAE